MKNFTLILSAVMLASSAFAAPALKTNSLTRDAFSGKKVERSQLSLDQSKMMRANSAIAPVSESTIQPIWEVEGGQKVVMNCNYTANIQGEWDMDSNVPAQVIYGENNEVYFKDLVPSFLYGSYIKGEKAGDQITIEFPQAMGYYSDGYLFLNKMEWVDGEYVIAEDNSVTFTIYDDGSMGLDFDNSVDETDPKEIIGMCYGVYPEEQFYLEAFLSYSEYGDIPYVTPTIPESVKMEQFICNDGWFGKYWCQVGFEGDTVYIKGAFPNQPEIFFTGKIDGDKIIFTSGDYLGIIEDYYYAFLLMINDEQEWVETMAFDYDPETRTISPEEGTYPYVMESALPDAIYYIDYLMAPSWYYVPEDVKIDPTPYQPMPNSFMEYDWDWGYGVIVWEAPAMSIDELPFLDAKGLYANLYVNGEQFVADPYLYELEEPMSDFPYGYMSPYGDINWSSSLFLLYLFGPLDAETLSMQLINEVDGVKYKSYLMTWDLATDEVYIDETTCVDSVSLSEAQQVGATFYNLSGQKVANPENGFFIMDVTFSDGSHKAMKVRK